MNHKRTNGERVGNIRFGYHLRSEPLAKRCGIALPVNSLLGVMIAGTVWNGIPYAWQGVTMLRAVQRKRGAVALAGPALPVALNGVLIPAARACKTE